MEESMKRKMLSGKELVKLGYPEGRAIGIAINTVLKHFRRSEKDEIYAMLRAVLASPKDFISHSIWNAVAFELVPRERKSHVHELRKNRLDYRIFGASEIEEGARNQMEIAMKLPVTVAGALMPDAHQGYGLPIGGVLATQNAVIPYAVGVDIACRMKLTVYDRKASTIAGQKDRLANILEAETRFGMGCEFKQRREHDVMDGDWKVSPVTQRLRDKAWSQLGTSGSGNHFVEFGAFTVTDAQAGEPESLGLPAGEYVA